jgi:GNAT superfamily N-acetyltransferase
MTTIAAITGADREGWLPLWQDYLVFYESEPAPGATDDVFARLVGDLDLHGAIARDEAGTAVGIVHWLFHASTWTTASSCYLEDLFVAPGARGGGVGRALIAHVRGQAEAAGADKVHWLTQRTNAAARALYDQVAADTGFVHYEIGL